MIKTKSNYYKIHQKFAKKHQQNVQNLWQEHKSAWKILTKTEVPLEKVGQKALRFVAGGALAAALTFIPALPSPAQSSKLLLPSTQAKTISLPITTSAIDQLPKLSDVLPSDVTQMDKKTMDLATNIINQEYSVKATSILEKHVLPNSYGWIGAEQHLQRFPGDVSSLHDEDQSSGIAPKVGAWGYFASSPANLTADLKLKEKYYVAIQTFNLPQWNKDWPTLKEWFKYRKVIIVNPDNQRAVVAVVADSGPADYTGKQMGGSPEVMDHLGLSFGMRKGKVLMFFVDDPKNLIPLGEIELKAQTI